MFALHDHAPARGPARPPPAPVHKPAPARNPLWHTLSLRPVGVQARLEASRPGDPHEREAERAADRVMAMPGEAAAGAAAGSGPAGPAPEAAAGPGVGAVPGSAGRPLEPEHRAWMEARFGCGFGEVRVHTGAPAQEAARGLGARAFTVGSAIAFGAGSYRPDTGAGKRLLAHELAHVVQQRAGTAPAGVVHRQAAGGKAPAAAKTPGDEAFFEWWKKIAGLEGSLDAWKAEPANAFDKGGETNWGVTKATFMQLHNAAGLPATDEAFAAMTPEQAMGIGRSLWRTSRADRLVNPGVAILVADWFWGSTSWAFVRIKRALVAMGHFVPPPEDELDSVTIGLMNSLPPAELIAALHRARLGHIDDIVKNPKNEGQGKFEKGWIKRAEERRAQADAYAGMAPQEDSRAMLYQDFRRALDRGETTKAARLLNGFNDADIERFLKPLAKSQVAGLHAGALHVPAEGAPEGEERGVGPGSAVARITRYRFQVYSYETARKAGDWKTAALFLNGFSAADIRYHLKQLKPAQVALLHQGALDHPDVGPGSRLAQMTAAGGK